MLPIIDGIYHTNSIIDVDSIEVIAKEYPDISSIHGTRWFSKIIIVSQKMVLNDIHWLGDSIEKPMSVNK